MEIEEDTVYKTKNGMFVHVKEVTRHIGDRPTICSIVTGGESKYESDSKTNVLRYAYTKKDFLELIKIEKPKMDFSQWIGRCGDTLAIKGDKMLKSTGDGISYSNNWKELYTYPVDYEVVNMSDLNYGDVFIKYDIEEPEVSDFGVFIGIDNEGDYLSQCLCESYDLEHITRYIFSNDRKVKRFLRE